MISWCTKARTLFQGLPSGSLPNQKDLPKEGAGLHLAFWTVPVGPQHLNFGNHANHAFIFDTAWQALPTKSMAITYVAEVGVHDVLQCRKDLRNEEIIWVTRSSSSESESLQKTPQDVVAVAKALGQ